MRLDDVVNGWAEIATVLGCSKRTAQRWARAGWLCVYKHPGAKRPRVYAYRTEISTWRERCRTLRYPAPERTGFEQKAPAHALQPSEHLWGWKAIARFLNMSVRSVQRWEREAKLPICRLKTGNRPLPYALKGELSAWISERTVSRQSPFEIDNSCRGFPALLQHFLNASTSHTAVLDVTGTVIFVNEAWRVFAKANGYRKPDFGVGTNYFEICSSATGQDATTASLVAHGLVALLEGKRRELKVKYRCDSPMEKRIFLLRATRFDNLTTPFLVLEHSDVTNVL
jgi:hypothetical protein